MKLISTVNGTGSSGTISLTSIPQTFTDLYLTFSLRSTTAAVTDYPYILFNGSTTGYTIRTLSGNGSSATSQNISLLYIGAIDGANATSNTYSNIGLTIPNYASSNKKTTSSEEAMENNATSAEIYIIAGLWDNTAAITSIDVVLGSGNYTSFSTVSLYGITKGSGGATVS
jgi:hypothetical protein